MSHPENKFCSGMSEWRECPYMSDVYGVSQYEWICDCDYAARLDEI